MHFLPCYCCYANSRLNFFSCTCQFRGNYWRTDNASTPVFTWTCPKALVCWNIKDKTVIPEGIVFFKSLSVYLPKDRGVARYKILPRSPVETCRSKKRENQKENSRSQVTTFILHRWSSQATLKWTSSKIPFSSDSQGSKVKHFINDFAFKLLSFFLTQKRATINYLQ